MTTCTPEEAVATFEHLKELWGTYHRLGRELDRYRHCTNDEGCAKFDAIRDELIAHIDRMKQEGLRP